MTDRAAPRPVSTRQSRRGRDAVGRRLLVAGLVVGLVAGVLVGAAGAAEEGGAPVGSNFRVGGGLAADDETTPEAVYNFVADHYLVVWNDNRRLGINGWEIYGQLVAGDGSAVAPDFRISGNGAISDESTPAVVYNPDTDQYLVVWTDVRSYDIYAKLVSSDGSPVGADFRVNTGAKQRDDEPAVGYSQDSGTYLVVWSDGRDRYTRGSDIYGQLVSGDGSPVGSNFRVNDGEGIGSEGLPAVAYNLKSEQYLVTWTDGRKKSRVGDVYAQLVAADGLLVGPNFRVSGGGGHRTARNIRPAVAYNQDAGEYLVVWEDERKLTTRGWDVYAQRVSAVGSLVGYNFRVSSKKATGDENYAAVAYSPNANQYIIVWEDSRKNKSPYFRSLDVFGQTLSGTGSRVAFNFKVNQPTGVAMKRQGPAVAFNSDANQVLVAWTDLRSATPLSPIHGKDIYAQRVAP